jgi:hypothetical protein
MQQTDILIVKKTSPFDAYAKKGPLNILLIPILYVFQFLTDA